MVFKAKAVNFGIAGSELHLRADADAGCSLEAQRWPQIFISLQVTSSSISSILASALLSERLSVHPKFCLRLTCLF